MNEVDEKVVSFEIAKLLKKMGYDERIREHWLYTSGGKYPSHHGACVHLSNTEWEEKLNEFAKAQLFSGKYPPISAPSYGMVIDWIYRKYGYFVEVMMVGKDKFRYGIASNAVECGLRFSNRKGYPTRYEAMDAAFKKVLKIINEDKETELTKQVAELLQREKKDEQAKDD